MKDEGGFVRHALDMGTTLNKSMDECGETFVDHLVLRKYGCSCDAKNLREDISKLDFGSWILGHEGR